MSTRVSQHLAPHNRDSIPRHELLPPTEAIQSFNTWPPLLAIVILQRWDRPQTQKLTWKRDCCKCGGHFGGGAYCYLNHVRLGCGKTWVFWHCDILFLCFVRIATGLILSSGATYQRAGWGVAAPAIDPHTQHRSFTIQCNI